MNDQTVNMEQDMRHVFDNALQAIGTLRDRTITALASHSRQAHELEDLKQRFNEMTQRMDSVVQEAQRIRQDLHVTITERDKYKKEAEENLSLANSYQQERDEARARVEELHTKCHDLNGELVDTKRERDQLNTLVERGRRDLDWTNDQNKRLREERDEARSNASKMEQALKEANDKLGTLQNTFKQLFPASPELAAAKPVEVPGVAPSFRQEETSSHVFSDPSHEAQPVGEGQNNVGVNERIDQKEPEATEEVPWWKKDQPKAS